MVMYALNAVQDRLCSCVVVFKSFAVRIEILEKPIVSGGVVDNLIGTDGWKNPDVLLPRYLGERVQDQGCGRETFVRSEEHTSELQSPCNLVCRLLLEKKKQI